jgi:hypothetical protein
MKKRTVVHKHLRLQHHRHTGRVLHHQHTSYRGLAIIIGLAGVLMFTLNNVARTAAATMSGAGTLTVTASNPAPLPTIAAVITSPANNAVVHKAQLQVRGTCQASGPPNIVTIVDNGVIVGSTPCQSDSTFSLSIVLELGKHTLVAQTYTITDGLGPDSAPVTVFYTLKGSTGSPATGENNASPLVVTADRAFIIFGPDKDAVWTGTITGGKQPYTVYVDWGDGNAETYTVTESGEQYFVHRYRAMRPYVINMSVTDTSGQKIERQYAAATPFIPPSVTIAPTNPWNNSTLLGLYGAYLLVLVIFGALWARTHPSTYLLVPVPARRRANAKHSRVTKRSR